jgi:proteasome lid subunit RPN8/RPN11
MSEWTTGDMKCAEKCSHLEERGKNSIHIPLEISRVIRGMCRKFPDDEWQLLLKGHVSEDRTSVEVTGYYVPEQEVTGSTVKNTDMNITREFLHENKIIAGIHSHVNMGVFFSGTDEETTKSSIRYHVVTNNRGDYVARGRYTLACGMEGFKDMDIVLDAEVSEEVDIEGIERVKKHVYETKLYGDYDYTYTGYTPKKYGKFSQRDKTYWEKQNDLYDNETMKGFAVPEEKVLDDDHEGSYYYDKEAGLYFLDNGVTFEGKYAQNDMEA